MSVNETSQRFKKSLYVFPAGPYVKVGVSNSPAKRWATLKGQFSDLENPAFVSEPVWYPFHAESEAHTRLREFVRLERGKEWFSCPVEMAVDIVKSVLKTHVMIKPPDIPDGPSAPLLSSVVRLRPRAPPSATKPAAEPITLALTEAAAFLHMSEDALLRKARAGIVPGDKPGRQWVFIRDDLIDWMRERSRERRERQQSGRQL